jgi:cytochrome c-type biogenesis protein CcmE
MKTYGKFAALIVVIAGTLVWLAAGGVRQSGTYYKTVGELREMGNGALGKRLRVGGDVEDGSIVRTGRQVAFSLNQDKLRLKVIYDGTDPLPDTFRAGAQALVDGKMERDGVFRASKIQAKCASKYEAKPGQGPGAMRPAGV